MKLEEFEFVEEIRFGVSPKEPAGAYWMGGLAGVGSLGFMLARRPSWWHRKMVRLVLGWEWRDQ